MLSGISFFVLELARPLFPYIHYCFIVWIGFGNALRFQYFLRLWFESLPGENLGNLRAGWGVIFFFFFLAIITISLLNTTI